MRIRFDDRRRDRRRSFGFTDPLEIIVARDPDDVAPAIIAAEERAFAGAWVAGFLSYEAATGLDPVLKTHPPATGMPLAWFGVFDAIQIPPALPAADASAFDPGRPDEDADEYRAALAAIRRHIAAGDTYQVNHTLRLRGRFTGDPLALYSHLLAAQSAGFAAYLDLGDLQVLSVSPELFFRWDAGEILTRPMKGTVRRGRWAGEDEQLEASLATSEKDQAENLMIVDLLRNDLGRIARYGTVEVPELFGTERYETVWQMTSSIQAAPRPDVGLLDVFTSLFPSGSVTGAPKARTMEIIRELERSPRGVYCGSIGLLAPPGSGEPRAQFNVAIRTLVIDGAGRTEYGTGGGITWDSVDDAELDEAIAKAQILTHRRPPFSLLETMAWSPESGIRHRKQHVARLAASAAYFDLPFPAADVADRLDAIVGDQDRRVRLLLDEAGTVRVETSVLDHVDGPVQLVVDTEPVDSRSIWLFHKTTNRAVYEAAALRHPGADDVVLTNSEGFVTETTRATIAVRLGDRWLTPPIADGCLPGVLRGILVEEGTLQEQSITVETLLNADELATISSLRGWRRGELG